MTPDNCQGPDSGVPRREWRRVQISAQYWVLAVVPFVMPKVKQQYSVVSFQVCYFPLNVGLHTLQIHLRRSVCQLMINK